MSNRISATSGGLTSSRRSSRAPSEGPTDVERTLALCKPKPRDGLSGCARDECDRNARRLGMSRREFLLSLCGAATTLLALNACADEATRPAKGRKPGGTFEIPATATTDPDAARAALAGDEFVFDVQGHFLEYRVDPPTRQAREFWTGFPQRQCGEADGRACYSIARFMEEVFL